MPFKDPLSEAAKASKKRASRKYYKLNRKQEIARSSNWVKSNINRVKELSIIRRSTKLPPAKVLYNNAKSRAKAQNIPFSIEVIDILIPVYCPVLGLELKINTGNAKDNSASLDRIIPELGYIKSNIQVISHKANTMKSNATLEELKKLVKWLEQI